MRVVRHGRLLDDFVIGDTYDHPWELTVDEGVVALFGATLLDAMPAFASRACARALGFRDRPLHPMLLLNLTLSFSVHDVSEQAVAPLAYLDVRFPEPAFAGDTVRASSTVLGAAKTKRGDRGVVHVRTTLTADGRVVCGFERKLLVPVGTLGAPRGREGVSPPSALAPSPPNLAEATLPAGTFGARWEDFVVGDVLAHDAGHTVTEGEHVLLTTLVRNTHPLHTDEVYARARSFAKTRVVYGGLVLAWVLGLASRDVAGSALWILGLDDGAHTSGVLAGDTLYAVTKVLAKNERDRSITLRVVGCKNRRPDDLFAAGVDPFAPDCAEAAVAITVTLLVARG